MNKSILLKTYVASAILCLTLFASCSADDDNIALPEGKYPMTFATAMEGLTQTRATTDNTWTGDEKIAVQVDGEVKEYKPTSDKTATLTGVDAANTFYWQKADETKLVSAWYCGDGSNSTGGANVTQLPTTWTVKTDQSGDGYAASDLLYAMSQKIAYSDRDRELTFKHLPAKVVINLTKGNGLTEENIQSATVSIVSQTTTSGTINATDGTVTQITTSGTEEITTNNVQDALPAHYQKSVQAIVVPQQLAKGTKFIKVTIGKGDAARDYYYTTKSDTDVDIECGKQYTYNITVTKGEELVVTNQTAVTWKDGTAQSGAVTPATSFNVTCPSGNGVDDLNISNAIALSGDKYTVNPNQSITISYKTTFKRSRYNLVQGIAKVSTSTNPVDGTITLTVSEIRGDLVFSFNKYEYVEVGDYYYADGTWSPDYPSGSSLAACIGIVFKVGAAAGDAASNYGDKLPNGIRGYVVALTDANDNAGAWGIRETNVNGIPDESRFVNKYNGYSNTYIVRQLDAYKKTNVGTPTANGQYWAFKVASEYSIAAPSISSGWYLPSIGQLTDIYNLQNRSVLIAAAGGNDFKTQENEGRYWSSTEKDNADAWYYRFNGNGAFPYAKSNDYGYFLQPSFVRTILTF